MSPGQARVVALQLKSFKSFRHQVLYLDPFTLLVGRNGSGKSNALDGLWTLSRLSTGFDIREALDGGREGPEVRGGASGCAPHGSDSFTLGCTVLSSRNVRLHYEVTVVVDPVVQIKSERLWKHNQAGARKGQERDILRTDAPDLNRGDIVARWDNQKQGLNPPVDFRASQLLLSQVSTRVPATSAAGREVHDAAAQVLSALRSVFVLDPVPHQMRQYVRRNDVLLRRNAENISAAIAQIIEDPTLHDEILGLVQALNEAPVIDIGVAESPLEDVMLTVTEKLDGQEWAVPARQLSDGSLRFLALLAALLQTESRSTLDVTEAVPGQTTLVIEELENGLHPSQAARIVSVLESLADARGVRILSTTHSPAMLDALTGDMHRSVMVCWRDPGNSMSELCRLPQLDSYLDLVTEGSLGDAAVADELRDSKRPITPAREALDRLFSA